MLSPVNPWASNGRKPPMTLSTLVAVTVFPAGVLIAVGSLFSTDLLGEYTAYTVSLIALVFSIISMIFSIGAFITSDIRMRGKYLKQVSKWLLSEYEIEVTPETISNMSNDIDNLEFKPMTVAGIKKGLQGTFVLRLNKDRTLLVESMVFV